MSGPAMFPELLALRDLLDARRDEFRVLLDRCGATGPMLFGSVARGILVSLVVDRRIGPRQVRDAAMAVSARLVIS